MKIEKSDFHIFVLHHVFLCGCVYIFNCVQMLFKQMYTLKIILQIIQNTPVSLVKCVTMTEVN